MSTSKSTFAARIASHAPWIVFACLANIALAQGQRFEITPLFGGRAGGAIKVELKDLPPVQGRASLSDSPIFGVAAGYHFFDEEGCEDCSLVEFRWTRQNTHLGFKENTPVPAPLGAAFGRIPVTLDHYLADLTHEWNIEHAATVRPYVTASVGASRLSTGFTANTRFAFGLGGGVKVFPLRHWGFRFHVEYLPTVLYTDIQTLTCISTCVVALNGGVMNQIEFVVGPVFRF